MIRVLGTGSTGNCYIIEAANERLLIECGVDWKSIQVGLGFRYKNTTCLLSHPHKDHSKSYKQILKNGIDIYTGQYTIDKLGINNSHRVQALEYEKAYLIGGFQILPLKLHHFNLDNSECPCMGFLIKHKDIGKVLFVTDSYYFEYKFKDLDYILIEANYSEKLIEDLEDYKNRIYNSHMSLETCKKFLEITDTSKTKLVLLIHLSSKNADSELFKSEIENICKCKVEIASKGFNSKDVMG